MAALPAFAAAVAPVASSVPAGARPTSAAGRGRWRGWLGLSNGFSSGDLGGVGKGQALELVTRSKQYSFIQF